MAAMVHFIGAGPGDPELITIKGQRLIEEADVIIFAGSLVNPAVLDKRTKDSVVYDSAYMSLDEVMDVTIRNRGNVHQILTDAVLTVKGPKGDTVTLSGNEQISGIDSTNILARKEVTKTIAWPDGLEFVEGGKYTGSLEYSET